MKTSLQMAACSRLVTKEGDAHGGGDLAPNWGSSAVQQMLTGLTLGSTVCEGFPLHCPELLPFTSD
jgi:hypothetical protein